jgi:hypothetical protein
MYLSHQLGKTKPILTAMPIRRSAFPGAKRAKQSQFPAVQGGSRPGGREAWRAIVQNEANLAPVSGNGRAGKPGGLGRGSIVQNEANFQRANNGDNFFTEKWLWRFHPVLRP